MNYLGMTGLSGMSGISDLAGSGGVTPPSSLLTGLAAYWKLEDLTDALGVMTLTNHNGVTFTPGKVNDAGTFTVAGSKYLSVAANAAIQSSGGSFSLDFWIKPTNLSATRNPISRWGFGNDDWQFQVNSDGLLLFRVFNNSGSGDAFVDASTAVGTITAGNWFKIYLEYDSVAKKAGIAVNAGSLSQSSAGSWTTRGNDSNPLMIGELQGQSRYWDGQIDEIGYWLRKQTSDEIATRFNYGIGNTYPNFSLSEVFDLRYTVSGSPASDVKGQHTATYGGVESSSFSDYLDAASAKAIFEQVYTEVAVTLIDKGYRVGVITPSGNLVDPTLTPSTTKPLNDGSGTVAIVSSRDYVAPVTGVTEVVTITGTVNLSNDTVDTNGNRVTYFIGDDSYAGSPGSGWSLTNSDGTNFTFTCNSTGAHSTSKAAGAGTVTVDTPGVDAVAEVFGQLLIGFSGAAGWIDFAGTPIPLGTNPTDLIPLLSTVTAATASDGVLDSSSLTVNYTAPNSPGSPTIGGRVGAAVTASIVTIQDGT